MSANATVRWGILGCGAVARSAVAPAIRWSRGGELRAVSAGTRDRAEADALAVEAAVAHVSHEDLLADPTIDAIYLGLALGEHAAWARAAANAGKHVLCETSLTRDPAEATELGLLFAARRLRLVEAFMVRHHPQWSRLRALLATIGPVEHVRAVRRLRSAVAAHDGVASDEDAGGALFEVTSYPVNLARFVFGAEPTRVRATAQWRAPGVDKSSDALLEFGEGRVASVHGSLDGAPEESAVVSGARGRITLAHPFTPGWGPTEIIVETAAGTHRHPVAGANHTLHMVEHVEALVRDPALEAAPAEDGVANVAVLAAMSLSARTGGTVAIR